MGTLVEKFQNEDIVLFEAIKEYQQGNEEKATYIYENTKRYTYRMDCTGGGFHNESYTRGYCYFCGGKVEFRQCMWTEMGKLCSKNESLGAYEKIEFDQNHFMYLNSCDCSKNWIMIDGEDGKGLILVKEYCSICGAIKE